MVDRQVERFAQFLRPVSRSLVLSGIDQIKTHAVKNLSGGMERRLCFGGCVQPTKCSQVSI